jgi:hypothetical protein
MSYDNAQDELLDLAQDVFTAHLAIEGRTVDAAESEAIAGTLLRTAIRMKSVAKRLVDPTTRPVETAT